MFVNQERELAQLQQPRVLGEARLSSPMGQPVRDAHQFHRQYGDVATAGTFGGPRVLQLSHRDCL
jgi:hypothetical protein